MSINFPQNQSVDALQSQLSRIEGQVEQLAQKVGKGTLNADQMLEVHHTLDQLRAENKEVTQKLQGHLKNKSVKHYILPQRRAHIQTALATAAKLDRILETSFRGSSIEAISDQPPAPREEPLSTSSPQQPMNPLQRGALNEYQKQISQFEARGHRLNPDQKVALWKAIRVALTTDLSSGGKLITVDGSNQTFYAGRTQGGDLRMIVAKPLPEGGDAKPYIIGTGVLKTPQNTPQAQAAVRKEAQMLRSIDRSRPGGDHVVERHAVADVLKQSDEGILLKYYNQGDFKGHVMQQAFLNEVLGLTDRQLEGMAGRGMILQAKAEENQEKAEAFLKEHGIDESLETFVQKIAANYRPMTPQMGVEVGKQLAQGLMCLHQQGIYHGDVKPENVLWEVKQDGAIHLVHADLSKGTRVEERMAVMQHAKQLRFPSHQDKTYLPNKQMQGLSGAMASLATSRGQREVGSREEMMALLKELGVFTEKGGVFTADPKRAVQLQAVLDNPKKMEDLKVKNKEFYKLLMKSEMFVLKDGKHVVNVRISDSLSGEMKEIFRFGERPRMGIPGTPEYSNTNDEGWIDQFGAAGNEDQYKRALESQEVYTFGVTLYEMATGMQLERDKVDFQNVETELKNRGFSNEYVSLVREMLQDTGIPVMAYKGICESLPFSKERDQEISEIQRGERQVADAPLFQAAIKELKIDPSRLQFRPRMSMQEVASRLAKLES